MELQERLKAVRKFSKKTQADFGKALGCSRDTIANYEGGRAVPTNTFLQLICNKFPISESWLISGEGEMFLDNETTLFSNFAKQYDLSEAEQNLARFLLTMKSEERQKMLHYVTMLADAIKGDTHSQESAGIDVDAETAKFRDELVAINDANAQDKPSPSTAFSGEKEA